jgi:hypothetical protein
MRTVALPAIGLLFACSVFCSAQTNWQGLVDRSAPLRTDRFSFTGTIAEAYDGNENYYDGDMGDFDGDGLMDRALGARYGLLKNTGAGLMTPYASAGLVNYLFRGVSPGWGEDAFQWADVDNDNDLDILQGGNGEPFTLQINSAGRFRTKWVKSGSALNIVNTDIDRDGDVDLVVAHSFCSDVSCGHGCPETNCTSSFPKEFHLWVNDGSGNFTDQAASRGFPANFGTNLIVGVVSGDVDNDGDFDIMLINGIQRGITLCRNNGSGNFTLVLMPFGLSLAPIRPITSGFSQGMNLGDIDNDGDLDLVCALTRDSAGTPHPQVGHAVFINDGAGNFVEQTLQRVTVTGYAGFLSGGNGKLVDLDYDGDFDFVALDVRTTNNFLQVFLNNGAGAFTFSTNHSRTIARQSLDGGTGADVDITDLNGDGVYDLWIGAAGQDVRILLNTYQPSNSIPPNIPRNFRVLSATTNGITLAWQHPTYADIARRYKVYRSTLPGLARQDRRIVKLVGASRHQDEGFAAPLTRWTTTAYLNDSDVILNGTDREVQFIDRTALPGVTYYYCVTHVGTENTESAVSSEKAAMVPANNGTDSVRPFLDIISPTIQDWSVFPRIILHYGDGGSGVDASTLRLSFNQPLGNPATDGRAAGADLSDLALLKTEAGFIANLRAPLSLPTNLIATLTAIVSDRAGNSVTSQVQLLPALMPAQGPVARIFAAPTNGLMPLLVALSATNSTDADGKLLRYDWYFSDGSTAVGPNIQKQFSIGGNYSALLFARDNQGGVNIATQLVSVANLQITRWIREPSGYRLFFPTAIDRSYRVQSAASLPSADWSDLGQVTGTGVEASFLDPAPGPTKFYRLSVE